MLEGLAVGSRVISTVGMRVGASVGEVVIAVGDADGVAVVGAGVGGLGVGLSVGTAPSAYISCGAGVGIPKPTPSFAPGPKFSPMGSSSMSHQLSIVGGTVGLLVGDVGFMVGAVVGTMHDPVLHCLTSNSSGQSLPPNAG